MQFAKQIGQSPRAHPNKFNPAINKPNHHSPIETAKPIATARSARRLSLGDIRFATVFGGITI
jgi:hypothetical protein